VSATVIQNDKILWYSIGVYIEIIRSLSLLFWGVKLTTSFNHFQYIHIGMVTVHLYTY